MTLMMRLAMVVPLLLLSSVPPRATAADPNAFWPQFHGPNRDNMSTESALLKKWPSEGPALLWKSSECGRGYSGVAVADGRIFTAGDLGDEEWVFALDMSGKLLWKTQNGACWPGPYPGSRTTPTHSADHLYQMNAHGKLTAFQATTGKIVWSVDLKDRFGSVHGTWGLAENVAVDGDRLFCVPGGSEALITALDKRTGQTIWVNTELKEVAAYSSPILVTHNGVRQLITMTQHSIIGVDLQGGKLLWSHPHQTPNDQNVNMPIYRDGYVFTASGHSGGGRVVKISADSRSATEVWHRRDLDNCHGGVMLIGNRLYGSACRIGGKGFFCADFLTGEVLGRQKFGKLSLTSAAGLIYGLGNTGTMHLLSPRADGFDIVSQFDVPRGDSNDEFWAHPVVCGGRLYIRHVDTLFAYDIGAK